MKHAIASLKDRLSEMVNMWSHVPFATIVRDIRQLGANEVMASSVHFNCDEALRLHAEGKHVSAIRCAARACGYGNTGPALAWLEIQRDCDALISAEIVVDNAA